MQHSWSKLQELLIPQRECGEATTRTELNLKESLSLAPQWVEHGNLLLKVPEKVKNFQCAWLFFLYCGFARAIFHIRTVRPESTEFLQRHNEQIWRCFCTIAGVAPEAPSASSRASTSLPLTTGGRVEECDKVAPCHTLGQLGRHHQYGSRTPSRGARVHP